MEAAKHVYNIHECVVEVQEKVPKLCPAQHKLWKKGEA